MRSERYLSPTCSRPGRGARQLTGLLIGNLDGAAKGLKTHFLGGTGRLSTGCCAGSASRGRTFPRPTLRPRAGGRDQGDCSPENSR